MSDLDESADTLDTQILWQRIHAIQQKTTILSHENSLLKYFSNQDEVAKDLVEVFQERTASAAKESVHIPHKIFIAKKWLDVLRSQVNSMKVSKTTKVDEIQVKCESMTSKMEETLEATKIFNQEVRLDARHHITKKIMAEKVEKYFKDFLNKIYTSIGKIKLNIVRTNKKRMNLMAKNNEKIRAAKLLNPDDCKRSRLQETVSQALLSKYEQEYFEYRTRFNRLLRDIDKMKKVIRNEEGEYNALMRQIQAEERTKDIVDTNMGLMERDNRRLRILKDKMAIRLDMYEIPTVMDYIRIEEEIHVKERQVLKLKSKLDTFRLLKLCDEDLF